ncbi:MAG TPA: hypothetical protein VE172_24970 [Stackebrandtia sp.]|jgi:hypothetical protein|uniref:hypothetical protein n=1 Tax=Stackebrandtia sp. TaxID=2023065 RepID=UPI002D7610BF|nr:hypothetical protein [Stackebrandtia sp.]HZE42062.1 hypothetical protein [Stackebrandtia sp.]
MPDEVTFTETMAGPRLRLSKLSIRVNSRVGDRDGLHGTVTGGAVDLEGRRFSVSGGSFAALVRYRGQRRMWYRIQAGPVRVYGVKTVTGRPWRIWRDTTRMRVLAVHPDGARVSGEVRITARGFAGQLTTMRGRPTRLIAFGVRFARRLVA